MKKNDLAILAAVVIISSVFAYILAGSLLGGPKKFNLKVEQIDKIQSTFPDVAGSDFSKFYNKNALNPTQLITIGDAPNTAPFKK
jgi:hypothetical protein